MRILIPLILIVVLVGAITLTTAHPSPRAEFTFISKGSVNIMDPAQMSYMQDIRMAQAIWEGLTSLHPETTQAIEGVAYFPPEVSADKRRYTFTLRPEAKWSNGDPVLARDFVRGWRRAIEPGTADIYAELISNHIAGVRDYVAWRTRFIESLTLARQLERGKSLSGQDARTLLTGPIGSYMAGQIGIDITALPQAADTTGWDDLAARFTREPRNFKRMGDRLLREHVEEMETRWKQVGIRTPSVRCIEVVLTRPTTYFPDLTAFSTYLPVHESIELLQDSYAVEEESEPGRLRILPLTHTGLWATDPQWTKPGYRRNGFPGPISNGPYVLTRWDFKQRMRLEANPYYWNAKAVRSKTVELLDIEYNNTAFLVYGQGGVDMMTDLTMDYTPELVKQQREGLRKDIHPIPCFGTYEYSFNCRPTLPDGSPNPLADARVRRALTMAINKRDLVNANPRLDNPPSSTFVPVGSIPGYPSPQGLPYDPERARRELAEAGYPDGKGFPTLPLLYNTGFSHEVGAQAIRRMWERELGIRVDLVGKEVKTFAEDKVAGRFAIARGGWFGDYNDPTTFLDLYLSDNSHNIGKWIEPRYDELLHRAGEETDEARRFALLAEAERILVEEGLPIIPLYQYVVVYAWPPNVTGIYPNPRMQFPMQYIAVRREK